MCGWFSGGGATPFSGCYGAASEQPVETNVSLSVREH